MRYHKITVPTRFSNSTSQRATYAYSSRLPYGSGGSGRRWSNGTTILPLRRHGQLRHHHRHLLLLLEWIQISNVKLLTVSMKGPKIKSWNFFGEQRPKDSWLCRRNMNSAVSYIHEHISILLVHLHLRK